MPVVPTTADTLLLNNYARHTLAYSQPKLLSSTSLLYIQCSKTAPRGGTAAHLALHGIIEAKSGHRANEAHLGIGFHYHVVFLFITLSSLSTGGQ